MDDSSNQFSPELRGELARWAAEREARMAARGVNAPEGTLQERLAGLDAAFEKNPDKDNPLVAENHELRRTVEILEDAVRDLLHGRLLVPAEG
jgi:phytoene/squalene synthetase